MTMKWPIRAWTGAFVTWRQDELGAEFKTYCLDFPRLLGDNRVALDARMIVRCNSPTRFRP
jgi:hypothetical protein